MELRPRKTVNWIRLHTGENLPVDRYTSTPTLEGTFDVNRLIWKRNHHKSVQYLVEWSGYHVWEASWEPEHHLPRQLIQDYHSPAVSADRLALAVIQLGAAFKEALKSSQCPLSVQFPLDIYRLLFSHKNTYEVGTLLNKDDLDKVGMPPHWWYRILAPTGEGIKIKFPVRLRPRCTMRSNRLIIDGQVKQVREPQERMLLYASTRACDLSNMFDN